MKFEVEDERIRRLKRAVGEEHSEHTEKRDQDADNPEKKKRR